MSVGQDTVTVGKISARCRTADSNLIANWLRVEDLADPTALFGLTKLARDRAEIHEKGGSGPGLLGQGPFSNGSTRAVISNTG